MTIYKERILEHYKHPHNFGSLDKPTHHKEMEHKSCGDEISIELVVEKGIVKDVRFTGRGCAISMASASMLTDKIKGMKIKDIEKMSDEDILELMKIPIGPVRMKCAILPLETIKGALQNEHKH